MLGALRKGATTWLAKILFGVLILSFAAWGIGDIVRELGEAPPAIEVGDVDIPREEITRTLTERVERLRPVLGPDFTLARAREMGMEQMVVRELVNQALLRQEAQRLGLVIPDAMVRDTITGIPEFQNDLGDFDRDRLRVFLSRSGLTEEGLIANVREDLQRSALVQAVGEAVRVPERMARTLWQVRNEQRTAEVVALPYDSFSTPAPTEQALKDYYEAHPDAYMAAETRGVTAVVVSAADLAPTLAATDEEIEQAYDINLDRFRTLGERDAAQILFDNEPAAAAAVTAIRSGTPFAEAAPAGNPPMTLTDVSPDDLPEAAAQAVFSATEGTVTDPVRSPLGWHVFQVTRVVPETTQPLSAVREEVAELVRQEKALEGVYDLSTELEDALAGGATLEEAAESLTLTLLESPGITREGTRPNGTAAEGLLTDDAFLEVLFTTEEGQQSFLNETDTGAYVLRVDHVTPAQPRPLAEVRDAVTQDWTAEQQRQAARNAADAAALALSEGSTTLADVAAEHGTTVATMGPFTRDGQGAPALPGDLVTALFAAEGAGAVKTAPAGEAALIARLATITEPEPKGNAVAVLAETLSGGLRQDVSAAFLASLQQRYPVRINQARLGEAP